MKTKLILFITLIFTPPVFAANCMDNATTQTEINQCSKLEANQADAELNHIYQQILALVKNDPITAKKIRRAEQTWATYRDAQIEMYYPPRANGWYGSSQSLCVNNLYTTLTKKRIIELKEWLKQPKEGDVCAVNYVK